jgi:hypothetical protein
MGMLEAHPVRTLIEPVPIMDTLCTGGLVLIEDLGFGARFVLASQQTVYEVGVEQNAVAAKIVVPYERCWPGIHLSATFMARRQVTASARLLRLVKG